MSEIIQPPGPTLLHLIVDAPRAYFPKIETFIKEYPGTKSRKILNYILAFEISKKTGKEHFHCTFECETPISTVRRHFKTAFNEQLNSLRPARNLKTVHSYTIKDGDIISYTYTNKQVKDWKDISYEKPQSNLKETRNFYNTMKEHILSDPGPSWNQREVGRRVLKYYHSKCKCFPFPRQLKQYIDSIYYAYLIKHTQYQTAEIHLEELLDAVLLN